MLHRPLVTGLALLLSSVSLQAQDHSQSHDHAAMSARDTASDTSYAAMQTRGKTAMGVDQYSSAHRFDDAPDGGSIELQRDPADSAGVRVIREHLAGITRKFSAGDFEIPGFVHATSVPGTAVM